MQSLNKLVLFILLISFSSAIGLSHEKITFEGNADENICEEVIISTNDLVFLEDRWLSEDSINKRDLKDYDLKISELDLEITYENPIYVNGSRNVKICIKGKEGIYNGIILFTEINGNGGIGTWLEIYIGNEFIPKEVKIVNPYLGKILRYSAILLFFLIVYLVFTIVEKRKLRLI
jgi:hypothetical protein